MSRKNHATSVIAVSLCLPALVHAKSELATIVGSVLRRDPVIIEAKARIEEADFLVKRSRAQHYPTLGLQTVQKLNATDTNRNDKTALALTGRLNIYSFGAIQSQVKRDKAKRDLLTFKADETRENLAYTVANLYLLALRAKELLNVEKKNHDRHQTIVDTLSVITRYDPGRRSELAQAQARQLQVRSRMYKYQRTMRINLAKLKRYMPKTTPTLRADFEPIWLRMTANRSIKAFTNHPSLLAQRAEMRATHYEMRSQKAANLPHIDLEVQQTHVFNRHNRSKQDPLVRVVLNWNFLNIGSYYTAQSYAKQYAASAAREKLLQQELSSRGQMALVDIQETSRQVQSALQQIEAAEKVVDMYQLQFKIGRRSLIELLNAHGELSNMEVTRVNAQNDRRVAMLEWLYAQAMLDAWVKQDQTTLVTPTANVMSVESSLNEVNTTKQK